MIKILLPTTLALCALQSPMALAMEDWLERTTKPSPAHSDCTPTPEDQASLPTTPNAADLELLNQQLFEAIKTHDSFLIRHLIQEKADVNAWGKDHWEPTPLTFAAHRQHREICKLLIAAKANVNLEDRDGATALMKTYSPHMCQFLIDAKASVNHQTKFDWTSLIYATRDNQPEICQLLIRADANVNLQTNKGETALSRAALMDYTGICKLLIEARANVYLLDRIDKEEEGTALMNVVIPRMYNENGLPTKAQIIESILGATARLNEYEKRSIFNWFLVYNRLLQKKIGFNTDLKKYIARIIQRSLAQDLYANAIRAGAAKALAIAQEKNIPELVMQLETHLNMDELEKIVRWQTWPTAPIKQTKPTHARWIQLQRSAGVRNLQAMIPREEEN